MNILYISALEGGKYSGPLYSVPKQIEAQSKEDNVYWVNLTKIEFENESYHYMNYKAFSLNELPSPFCKPDLVVFEEFYKIECCIVARKIAKSKIPYIIIPRCQMTEKYLKNKWLKKKIATIILFKKFLDEATAVQFLSKQEYEDSKNFYNRKFDIIPNGINSKCLNTKKTPKDDEIKCVFIGRYSIWQKGLDLLISATKNTATFLREANIKFYLYGPNERTGNIEEIKKIVQANDVEDLFILNGPVFDEEKKKILEEADLFIHTSRFEGLPMSVLEALSYGIPCIVTQGSNLKEEVENYDAGWTCDTNQQEIEKTLKKVSEECNKISEKKQNALELSKIFLWENIAVKTHEFYKKMIDERK